MIQQETGYSLKHLALSGGLHVFDYTLDKRI